jgi:hypothetical protein
MGKMVLELFEEEGGREELEVGMNDDDAGLWECDGRDIER